MSQHSSRGQAWEKVRAAVLRNSGGQCSNLCGREATTVDHIIPKAAGGTDDISNLQAMCKTCNSTKGSRTNRMKRNTWYHPWWFPTT